MNRRFLPVVVFLCLVALPVLCADTPETKTGGARVGMYEGQWPVYKAPTTRVKETQRLYEFGPRQSYQEVQIADLVKRMDEYLSNVDHKGQVEWPKYNGPTFTLTAPVFPVPSFGGWSPRHGSIRTDPASWMVVSFHPLEEKPVYSYPQGCPVGVPSIYVTAPPNRDTGEQDYDDSIASVCKLWGVYSPCFVSATDSLNLSRRILAHKAIFRSATPEPDVLVRVDRAIHVRLNRPSNGTPLTDMYIFAAQVHPGERKYADRAVLAIENLLSSDASPAAESGSAAQIKPVMPADRADWEKRYFFLLGWLQENYLQDYPKALAAYKRVYVNYNQAYGYNDDAMMFSARVFARTGKAAEAQKLYRDLIKNYPNDFWSQDAADELRRLDRGDKPDADWPGRSYSL